MGPEQGIAHVLRDDGRVIGLAFVVAQGRLVTCAHVVNAALRRDPRDPSRPSATTTLSLRFPFGSRSTTPPPYPVTVVGWLPGGGGEFDVVDIAVLGTDDTVPATPLRLAEPAAVRSGPVQMWGPSPDRKLGGHVGGQLMGYADATRMQVDQELRGRFRVVKGFSGGPVWQRDTGLVVGVLQAASVEADASDAYALGVDLVVEAMPEPTAWAELTAPAGLTVLHVSDMQFGAHHRFGKDGMTEADRRHDTLAARLLDDLDWLRREHRLAPDLVVVAGDLAEWAMPAEYEAVYEFLTALRDGLGLPTERIVIVPGNHDVNRKKCQAYFLDREADGERPVAPYWPKWEAYAALHKRFYGTELPVDEPWLHVEFPQLRVAVAGLNSTMAKSHRPEDHYGWLGEEQLRYFATRMRDAGAKALLRIGVLHHNPVRGSGDDDAHLRDADRFGDILGDRLDLVLHGHTHDARVLHFGRTALPVLGAGSAGVADTERPPEVPNQYQIVHITPDGTRIGARLYHPGRRKWIGDTSISDDGDTWWRDLPSPRLNPRPDPYPLHRPKREERAVAREPDFGERTPGTLRERVREVCHLREPTAVITEVADYLRVSVNRALSPDGPAVIESYPIGVCETTATRADVERFAEQVRERFRSAGVGLGAKLVYGGPPAESGLRELASMRGVELVSFAGYQLGYDLRPYAQRQALTLAQDRNYPPDQYVPQRYVEIGGTGATEARDDVLERLRYWLADPDGHLIALLGPFGHGKTFLLRELARRMHEEDHPAVPLLIHLRDLEKTQQLDQLAASQLAAGGERRIDLAMFNYLLREGRIALLFDGFDELAVRVRYDRATEHLNTIVRAAAGRAKVVFTSRDHYFLADGDVLNAMGDRLATVAGRRLVKLLPFSDKQVESFLTKRMGSATSARERMTLLREVRDLVGLSRNPRMLSFIAGITSDRLLAARDAVTGEITAAALYRQLLEQWLTFEQQRLARDGTQPPGIEQLWTAVTLLAVRMWLSGEPSLGVEDLGHAADALTVLTDTEEAPGPQAVDRSTASHLLGSATLLVRDGDARFTFVHRSVMEWLVAKEIATALSRRDGELPPALTRDLSALMTEFLCGLDADAALDWATGVVAQPSSANVATQNALGVLARLGVEPRTPARLAGQNLRGHDFTGQDLRGADLAGADLTEARMVRTKLGGADLTGAVLARARLDEADLSSARLERANLAGASLLDADLGNADLTGADLRRVALLGARLPREGMPTSAMLTGAALVASDGYTEQFAPPPAPTHSVAFSPNGSLLAAGGADGVVRVWDAHTGALVRDLKGHTGGVLSVAFSPDGTSLASGGDDRVVRVWDAHTGTLIRDLTGHTDWVWSVVFSPDGTRLATGGDDRVVLVWDTHTGTLIRDLTGHTGRVRSVVFSRDGTRLASGGEDGVRVWGAHTGTLIRDLTGHTDWVRSVVFSPDGTRLASGGDRVVRVWDAHTGTLIRDLTGRTGGVWSVVFSPDGTRLATGGDDRVVRVWDTHTGTLIRDLTGHTGRVRSVVFSRDGTRLASGGEDEVRVWDTHTGTLIRDLTGHTGAVWSVVFSPDGTHLATGGNDRVVRVWDAHTGTLIRALTGRTDWVRSVVFSPDGTHLASGGRDGVTRVWDAHTGTLIRDLTGHTGGVWSVVFSPDGTHLASGGRDGVTRVWDAHTGTLVRALTGHAGGVLSVVFSPDGTRLASGGADRVVRVWDVDSGQRMGTLVALTDGGYAVLGADGSYKLRGQVNGEFWYAVNMVRFEPGVLDKYVPAIRQVSEETPFLKMAGKTGP